MKTNPEKDCFKYPILVAPDRATAGHVNRVLKKSNIEVSVTIAKTRGGISEASKLVGENRVVLVLVPSPKLGKGQLALTRRVVEAGGFVFAWVSRTTNGKPASRDEWYLSRLLEQQGATPLSRLGCLVEAVKIVTIFGEHLPQVPVFVKSSSNSLRSRVVSNLTNAGVQVSKTQSKKGGASVSVSSDGEIFLKVGNRRRLAIEHLSSFTQALALLFRAARSADKVDEPVIEPERSEIELIVRPPARLLSETASKRIVRAFGVESPEEQLCQSPSEAVRFAGTLGSPVTLKLVKPGLEDKKAVGAVIADLRGALRYEGRFILFYRLLQSWGRPSPWGFWCPNR